MANVTTIKEKRLAINILYKIFVQFDGEYMMRLHHIAYENEVKYNNRSHIIFIYYFIFALFTDIATGRKYKNIRLLNESKAYTFIRNHTLLMYGTA